MGQVTDTGYVAETLPQITEKLSALWFSVYGDNISIAPDTPDGQLIGLLAQIFVDYEELGAAIYQQLDPRYATSRWLDQRMGYASLVRRLGETSQLNSVLALGKPNETIRAGFQALDSNRVRWITTTDAQTDSNGQTYLNFASEELGNFTLPAGVKINPVAVDQITSLTTTKAAVAGSARETDASARNRILARQLKVNTDNAYAIQQAILSVDGVKSCTVYENDQNVADARGLPPHSLWVIVDGGNSATIGEAILNTKTSGAYLKGTQRLVVTDKQGIKREVGFDRPLPVDLKAELTITRDENTTAVDVDAIKAALLTLRFAGGQDVAVTRLYSEVNKVPGFWVNSFTIGKVGGTMVSTVVSIPDGSTAQFSIVEVTVN